MLIKKVTKNLFVTTLAFLIVVGLAASSVYFLSATTQKNEEYEKTLDEYSGGDTNISFLKSDIEKVEIMKEVLTGWLLAPDQTLELIQYIESISKAAGLNSKITDLNPQKVGSEKEKTHTALELIISLEGTLKETQTFLGIMENIPYQSFIKEMQLQRRGDKNVDLWQVKIQLIVYTKPLPKNNNE